jgi:hypothetical protein
MGLGLGRVKFENFCPCRFLEPHFAYDSYKKLAFQQCVEPYLHTHTHTHKAITSTYNTVFGTGARLCEQFKRQLLVAFGGESCSPSRETASDSCGQVWQ